MMSSRLQFVLLSALICVSAMWSASAQTVFTLAASTDELKVGDQIVFANTESGVALSTDQRNNNRSEAKVTISGFSLTVNSKVQVFTLERDGDGWRFRDNDGDGWLAAGSSSANRLVTQAVADANCRASVSIASGNAAITFQGINTHNTLRYNKSANVFSCYTPESNVRGTVQLFRQECDQVQPLVEVASVAAFNALAEGTEARLYLSDAQNARVVAVNGDDAWVRDNSDIVCFRQFKKYPTMVVGQHVAGYIVGQKTVVDGMNAMAATSATNTSLLIIARAVTEPDVDPETPTVIRQPVELLNGSTLNSSTLYYIDGRKETFGIKSAPKGVYITDGHKVVVR